MDFNDLVRSAAAVPPKHADTALGHAIAKAILAKMQRIQLAALSDRLLRLQGMKVP
jgi:hypothetical protein